VKFSALPQLDEDRLDIEAADARAALNRAIGERHERMRREIRTPMKRTQSRPTPRPLRTKEERRALKRKWSEKANADVRARRAALRLDPRYARWDEPLRAALASGAFI
jgi:hypothetical protein